MLAGYPIGIVLEWCLDDWSHIYRHLCVVVPARPCRCLQQFLNMSCAPSRAAQLHALPMARAGERDREMPTANSSIQQLVARAQPDPTAEQPAASSSEAADMASARPWGSKGELPPQRAQKQSPQ